MPITDNNFTGPELVAALEANKDLLPVVRGVLTDRKMTVYDETEFGQFKTNFETDVVKRKTSEYATQLEKDVLELTGIQKKDANEKYYDYFKRATQEKLASVNALQQELDALKGKHSPSEADKIRIKQLEDGLKEKQTSFEQALAAKDKEIHSLRAGSVITDALGKLRSLYKQDIPAGVLQIVEKTAVDQLLAIAKIQDDGTVTFLDKEGKPIVNKSNYQPETAETLLKEALKDVLDPGKQQKGAGSGAGSGDGGGAGGGTGGKTVITALPGDVKTKVQLTEYLLKNGYLEGDKDFTEAFTKFGEKLPLR